MTSRRRLREWPRLIAAVVVLAMVLVLVGVVIASAGSGTGQASTVAQLRRAESRQTASLRAARADLAQLRERLSDVLSKQARTRATSQRALAKSRHQTRCWRADALHSHRVHIAACLAAA